MITQANFYIIYAAAVFIIISIAAVIVKFTDKKVKNDFIQCHPIVIGDNSTIDNAVGKQSEQS